MYADDSQINIEVDLTPHSDLVAKERIEACVADICSWMCENKHKLNDDKTEFIVTPSQQPNKVDIDFVQVADCDINTAHSAHNHGATFDDYMTLQPQVSSIVRSCNWELHQIGQIRRYLTKGASED